MFVRPLTPDERAALKACLRSSEAFVVRRCQSLLKSADGLTPRQIERQLGWSDESVRRFIRAFNTQGLACLERQSSRPKSAKKLLDEGALAQLEEWLRQSPRDFGLPTSRWTLEGLAQVCAAQGLTAGVVSDETIRDAMRRLGLQWKRAKRWLESPDPAYARKKGPASG
jgi:transposase